MAKVYWCLDVTTCICPRWDGYVGWTSRSEKRRLWRHVKEGRVPADVQHENLKVVVLFEGIPAECRKLEWELRPGWYIGWNIAPGGAKGRLGVLVSDATKAKQSEAATRRGSNWDLMSDETKEAFRLRMVGTTNKGRVGQKKSDEERQKISTSHKGKKLSPEHNAKLQAGRLPAAHTGHHHSEETKETIRQKKRGVPVHSEEHKRELAERWKGNSLTKGKPWSAARRLAQLRIEEKKRNASLICPDQLGLFAEQSASNNRVNSGDEPERSILSQG